MPAACSLSGRLSTRNASTTMSCVDDIVATSSAPSATNSGERAGSVSASSRIAADQQQLREHQPAAAAAERAGEERHMQRIDQRRPEKLQRVGRADQREQPDGAEIDAGFAHPYQQRRSRQRQRQPGGKAEQQHDQHARLQIDGRPSRQEGRLWPVREMWLQVWSCEGVSRFCNKKTVIARLDRATQGGFKRSSQHSSKGGCDEETQAAFGSVWAGSFALARSTAGGRAREAATVLGGDCLGALERGCCGRGRGVAGGRNTMVPEGRRHATSDVWQSAKPLSGRYLSFAEREEIALLRVQGSCDAGASLAGSGGRHRRSPVSCGATPPPEAAVWSIVRRQRNGTPSDPLAAQSRRSLRSTRPCESMWRNGWLASSWPRAGRPFPARPCAGKDVGMDHGRTGGGQRPGARSRSPAACRSTSRTTRPCASAMKPSIKRCSFKVEARCAAN